MSLLKNDQNNSVHEIYREKIKIRKLSAKIF